MQRSVSGFLFVVPDRSSLPLTSLVVFPRQRHVLPLVLPVWEIAKVAAPLEGLLGGTELWGQAVAVAVEGPIRSRLLPLSVGAGSPLESGRVVLWFLGPHLLAPLEVLWLWQVGE